MNGWAWNIGNRAMACGAAPGFERPKQQANNNSIPTKRASDLHKMCKNNNFARDGGTRGRRICQMGRKKAMRRMTMCSQRAAISIPRCVRRPMSSAVNRCPSPARSEMSDSSSEVLLSGSNDTKHSIENEPPSARPTISHATSAAISLSRTYSTRIAMAKRGAGQ